MTQQLIKNITSDNEVSINRKLKEIFRALNVEREFTKDEILEAYLNTVNFGGNNNGIQAAATAYFDKDVKDLSLAQCAAIVGITQNPSRYNPLYFPEENKKRREDVLWVMLDQGKITEEEYKKAMDESANMTFVNPNSYIEEETEQVDVEQIQNWYIETVFSDLTRDLAEYLDISETAASNKLYTEGLKVYCAMDLEVQEQMENTIRTYPYFAPGAYQDLECGFCMMDYDGKVIAIVGSNKEKQGNLEWNRATDSALQPGSTIKGVSAYPLAINNGNLYYSSLVHDVPIEGWFPDTGAPGPNNWYMSYRGDMLLPDAIEISANATVANVLKDLVDPNGQDGVRYSYDYVTNKLGWTHLNFEIDSQNMAGLSIGGFNGGATVREMAKAYTLLGNGGKSYKPYTYYYVTDADDNVIIDNREQDPIQALTEETAAIMNRLLNYNIQTATKLWKVLMEQYLQGKEHKDYKFPDGLIVAQYCPYTGLLANTYCGAGHYGYYNKSNLPMYCTYHSGYNLEYTTWGELQAANQANTVSEQAVTSKSEDYYEYYNEAPVVTTPNDGTGTGTSAGAGDINDDVYSYDEDDEPVYNENEVTGPSIAEEPVTPGGGVDVGGNAGGDAGGGSVEPAPAGGDTGGGSVDAGGGDAAADE